MIDEIECYCGPIQTLSTEPEGHKYGTGPECAAVLPHHTAIGTVSDLDSIDPLKLAANWMAPPLELEQQRWRPQDLDRCEHGRHSIDRCFGCPGGWSGGNRYLLPPTHPARRMHFTTHQDGTTWVRIGTTYGSEPIWVCPVRPRRGASQDPEPCP